MTSLLERVVLSFYLGLKTPSTLFGGDCRNDALVQNGLAI